MSISAACTAGQAFADLGITGPGEHSPAVYSSFAGAAAAAAGMFACARCRLLAACPVVKCLSTQKAY